MVLTMAIQGIRYEKHEDGSVLVHAGAGVSFDALVADTVAQGLWGLENLSSIPGTVGGVPIQNVGAYGVEACMVIDAVKVYDRMHDQCKRLSVAECAFGYRDSLFKHEGKDRYIVTEVTFMLSRSPHPRIAYKDLTTYFGNTVSPSLQDIRNAVIDIRAQKFPDWHSTGTAGSFFKNPIIDEVTCARVRSMYPDLPVYETNEGKYKVALGWILDHVLNLKGYREGGVGLYDKQALVLVNYGNATADDVLAFSDDIITRVFDATGIHVEREVVVLA
jgi:UDP-N-acetylmuramate dehydrogenase